MERILIKGHLDRIVQLEEVCVSLDQAKLLNNRRNASHAWVWNPHKHVPEFELIALESYTKDLPKPAYIGLSYSTGKWELYDTTAFVAAEQIQSLIDQGIFYFAPLKNTVYKKSIPGKSIKPVKGIRRSLVYKLKSKKYGLVK